MKSAIVQTLLIAAVAAAASGCGTFQIESSSSLRPEGPVKGTLWLRATTSRELKTLSVVESDAKPPTWKICSTDCEVKITQVAYGSATCSMKIDPEVLVVQGNTKIRWVVIDANHEFRDGQDIKFPGQPSWAPIKDPAGWIELEFKGRPVEVQKYDITVRKKGNHNDGCIVDPLIVNTG